jgi:hypothetical protein
MKTEQPNFRMIHDGSPFSYVEVKIYRCNLCGNDWTRGTVFSVKGMGRHLRKHHSSETFEVKGSFRILRRDIDG